MDLDLKNLEEKHKLNQPSLVEKEKSLNLLYKTKAHATNRTKTSSSTPTIITANTAEGNIDDDNGDVDSINNHDKSSTTAKNDNNSTVATTATPTNKNNSNETTTPTRTKNNNNINNEPKSGYEEYRCMCGAIPDCKLDNILSAPTDFHFGTNTSIFVCKVCEKPLHAICYKEGDDNRCHKCKHDVD